MNIGRSTAGNPFDIAADEHGNPQPDRSPPPPEVEEPEVEEEQAGAAAASSSDDPPQPPPGPRKRRRGRPRGSGARPTTPEAFARQQAQVPPEEKRMNDMANATRVPDPTVPPAAAAPAAAAPTPNLDGLESEVPRDPASMWTIFYTQWVGAQRAIDDVELVFARVSINGAPMKQQPVLPNLRGSAFRGDAQTRKTPGEQVTDYITNFCHRDKGPAGYKVMLRNRHTGKTLRVSEEFLLEDYNELQRRNQDIADAERRRYQAASTFGAPHGGYVPFTPFGQPGVAPAPGAPPVAAAPAAAPAMQGTVDVNEMYRQLGYLQAVKEEADRARAEGRAPREVAPPPPQAPSHTGSDPDETFWRRLDQMRAMGMISTPGLMAAARPAQVPVEDPDEAFLRRFEMMRRMNAMLQPAQPPISMEAIAQMVAQTTQQTVVRLQEAGVIPKVAAAPPAPAPAPPALSAYEQWILARKKDREFEAEFRRQFPDYVHKDEIEARGNVQNPNDPDAGPAPSKEFPLSSYMGEALRWVPWPGSAENAPESWGEWVGRMTAENPRRSSDLFSGVLKAAANVLPFDKLAGLMEALTKRGGDAAAAAAAHTASNGGTQPGWSAGT